MRSNVAVWIVIAALLAAALLCSFVASVAGEVLTWPVCTPEDQEYNYTRCVKKAERHKGVSAPKCPPETEAEAQALYDWARGEPKPLSHDTAAQVAGPLFREPTPTPTSTATEAPTEAPTATQAPTYTSTPTTVPTEAPSPTWTPSPTSTPEPGHTYTFVTWAPIIHQAYNCTPGEGYLCGSGVSQ